MSLVSFFIMVTHRRQLMQFWLSVPRAIFVLRRGLHPTPCEEAPGGAVFSSIKSMLLKGEAAPSWWECLCPCGWLCLANQTDLGVKLLITF
jgi:hypothetical protein